MSFEAPKPEADGYRRYGMWAGNPRGVREDKTKCAQSVYPNERGPIPHQCRRKRGAGPKGEYCAQHAAMIHD